MEKIDSDVSKAKLALDKIIDKSRVHLYKPIQIAEILYHYRIDGDIDLLNLDDYRNKSKKWRDDITIKLLGTTCSSSSKFQDNLFDPNAIPPEILNILGDEDVRTNGAVEAYIYSKFTEKHVQLKNALDYCLNTTKDDFEVKRLIDTFWYSRGLKRSIDKVYEVVVYALFSTLIEALNLKVEISIDDDKYKILKEFEDFTQKIMCLDFSNPKHIQNAKVYRVGVTNAADRGIDMYSNWGPAIQIKHLSLDVELAESIVNSVSSDRIVIVCKEAEKEIILSLLSQIGWRSRIQSIVTENDLVKWYEKALRGTYNEILAKPLLNCLCSEIMEEFPSLTDELPEELAKRHYEEIQNNYWKQNNTI
jgi:hypothetical protein